MGINGLWKVMDPMRVDEPIQRFAGARIGVDAPHMLHALGNRYALELANGDCRGLISAVRKTVKFYASYNIHLVLVFDGQSPPMKDEESRCREEKRDRYRWAATQLHAAGGCDAESRELWERCYS